MDAALRGVFAVRFSTRLRFSTCVHGPGLSHSTELQRREAAAEAQRLQQAQEALTVQQQLREGEQRAAGLAVVGGGRGHRPVAHLEVPNCRRAKSHVSQAGTLCVDTSFVPEKGILRDVELDSVGGVVGCTFWLVYVITVCCLLTPIPTVQ